MVAESPTSWTGVSLTPTSTSNQPDALPLAWLQAGYDLVSILVLAWCDIADVQGGSGTSLGCCQLILSAISRRDMWA